MLSELLAAGLLPAAATKIAAQAAAGGVGLADVKLIIDLARRYGPTAVALVKEVHEIIAARQQPG